MIKTILELAVEGTKEFKVPTLTFNELWDLKNPPGMLENRELRWLWGKYEITAIAKKNFEMNVWNGKHDPSVEANCDKHICKTGTKVLIWMVSRFGDIGITDNFINPKGYDRRGVEAEELENWIFTLKEEKESPPLVLPNVWIQS